MSQNSYSDAACAFASHCQLDDDVIRIRCCFVVLLMALFSFLYSLHLLGQSSLEHQDTVSPVRNTVETKAS
eukprot:984450-Amphidinium_carterae.1